MEKETEQTAEWAADFGRDYTDRNPHTFAEMNAHYARTFGVTRAALNEEFVGAIDRSARVLEVGANVGAQLQGLQEMGFEGLYGIELQAYAVERAKELTKNVNLIQGSAFDIPFKRDYFDLVYTSGVLIHIAPEDIGQALDEIFRCAGRYIWGWEYYADEYRAIPYRDQAGLLWKTDFSKLYRDRFPGLRVVREKRVKYLASEDEDVMFLLEKA